MSPGMMTILWRAFAIFAALLTFLAVSQLMAGTPLSSEDPSRATKRWGWLPNIGTRWFHLMMLALGILILGPLGGVTAAFMNFSIGFFVGGQVLAGILGSTVTYGYGV